MKGRIYYFSGTGNSMRAARVIARYLENTEIISMRADPAKYPASDCDVIGFIYPVYHWSMPAPAAAFAEKLEINPKAYIFVIAMPSFICGTACEKLAEILSGKGARISYGSKVHSVANYAVVYPPVPPAKLIVPLTERKLRRIGADLAAKKSKPYPRAGRFIRQRRERVMTPYLELQKYADYPFTISESCISCGICAKVCPCGNIVLEDGRPSFQHHCANCMACVVCCPKRAIGYNITEGDKKLLEASGSKTPVVKMMGLPEKRKLYMNPYITAGDLMKERE